MGLGAYLATVTERQTYDSEKRREEKELIECPEAETEEIYEILCAYGASRDEVTPQVSIFIQFSKPVADSKSRFVTVLKKDPEQWVQFMMDFELRLEKPRRGGAYLSSLMMGMAYFVGGLLPMIPYFAIRHATTALFVSIGITAFVLIVFGYLKCKHAGCTAKQSVFGAVQTLCVGAVAAAASYGIVRAVNQSHIT
jgi:vacuolar iron transporter family protein